MTDPRLEEDLKKLSQSLIARRLWIAAGSVCLFLGLLGLVLPLLPTTPFLLLTATCYARGSRRFYLWLMNHRLLGPYIRSWREGRGIPLRAKVLAVLLIVITMGTSIVFFVPFVPAKIILGMIGLGVIVYLLRMPTDRGPYPR